MFTVQDYLELVVLTRIAEIDACRFTLAAGAEEEALSDRRAWQKIHAALIGLVPDRERQLKPLDRLANAQRSH